MKTAKIEIETKKGATTITKWRVVQIREFPCIDSRNGIRAEWANAPESFPRYSGQTPNIPRVYQAEMLRMDFDPATATGNRIDAAGYDGAPSLVYRGREMGEVCAEIRLYDHNEDAVYFRSFGYNSRLSTGETALFRAQVAPSLLAYVRANEAELKAEVLESLRESCAKAVADMRAALVELEEQAERNIAAL